MIQFIFLAPNRIKLVNGSLLSKNININVALANSLSFVDLFLRVMFLHLYIHLFRIDKIDEIYKKVWSKVHISKILSSWKSRRKKLKYNKIKT